MPLYFGSTKINDGDPLLMGTRQCDKVMRGSTQIWVNHYAADAPTTFTASNGVYPNATIDFTWTLPVDQGIPVCTYEVRRVVDDVAVATGGVSDTNAQLVTTVDIDEDYYVVAVSSAGDSPHSNTDNGSADVYSFTWSGSSLIYEIEGISTSGSDYVYFAADNRNGGILTADAAGLANGESVTETDTGFATTLTTWVGVSYNVSGTITYSITEGFSGSSMVDTDLDSGYQTSGGAIRYTMWDEAYVGEWITLT